MKKPFLIRLLPWCLPGVLLAREAEPDPFFQDEYSGKTVTSVEMAGDLVRHRFYNTPKHGEKAPPFVLPDLETGESVFLSELHAEKPVVLFFASYGCDVFRAGVDELLAVHDRFGDDCEFVMIYVREAHSLDGFNSDRAVVEDPETQQERFRVARECRRDVGLPFRILVDTMDDRTATRWGAWPVRLFVVDTDGIVIYSGRPGPWGFSPGGGFEAENADELRPHPDRFNEESLEEFLAKRESSPE